MSVKRTFLLILFPVLLSFKGNAQKSFEKIIFHTSLCFGSCPVYHLEVDSDKSVKLFTEKIFKDRSEYDEDYSKEGYFAGQLNNQVFNNLLAIITETQIDKLTFDGSTCCDGSLFTIIFYHDGTRKYLQSMFPPDQANKLIACLYSICQDKTLKKTTEHLEIEIPEPPKRMRIGYPSKN